MFLSAIQRSYNAHLNFATEMAHYPSQATLPHPNCLHMCNRHKRTAPKITALANTWNQDEKYDFYDRSAITILLQLEIAVQAIDNMRYTVELLFGKGEVESSILSCRTIIFNDL